MKILDYAKGLVGRGAFRILQASGWLGPWLRGDPVPRGSSPYLPVDTDTAMRISAVSACVRLIAGNVAKLPVHVYEMNGEQRKRQRDHPIETLLNRRPNRWQTAHEFRRMLTAHVALRGNGFALKRYEGARITELVPLLPQHVRVVQEAFDLPPIYIYQPPAGSPQPFAAEQILHLRDLSLDGVLGLSRIEQAQQGIRLASNAETFATSFFDNGCEPGLVLSFDRTLNDEQRKSIKEQVHQALGGPRRAHSIFVAEGGAKVERTTMTNKDSQVLELRSFQVEDIARLYGVPAHLIGLTEKQTSYGTGVADMARGFLEFHLLDWLQVWETAVVRDLLGPEAGSLYVEHLVEGLLRADIKTRMESYQMAIQNGILSPNEVRGKENLAPRKGGDDYWRPANMLGGEAPQGPLRPAAVLAGDRPRHAWKTKLRAVERAIQTKGNGDTLVEGVQ